MEKTACAGGGYIKSTGQKVILKTGVHSMNRTLFILGAGVNQSIANWKGSHPPLLRDFLKVFLNDTSFSLHSFDPDLQPLFDYIERYWKLDRKTLSHVDFDIEECFSLIQSQFRDAVNSGNNQESAELSKIWHLLSFVLSKVLAGFESYAVNSGLMREFGRILWRDKPNIITFNYDTITESIIESGSGLRGGPYPKSTFVSPTGPGIRERTITDDELWHSHYNWNRPLAYDFSFDLVQLHRAGPRVFAEGDRFYKVAANSPYDWHVLKLHGSLNWFRILPYRVFPSSLEEVREQPEWMKQAIVNAEEPLVSGIPPDYQGWAMDPIMITPVRDKDEFFNDKLFSKVFDRLWSRAFEILSNCNKVVIIGYSLAPSDFRFKKLVLEALSNHQLEELVVVNPSEDVRQRTERLFHPKSAIAYHDLEAYLKAEIEKSHEVQFKTDEELDEMFTDGGRLIESLDKSGFDVSSAFWIRLPPPSGWALFVSNPGYSEESKQRYLSDLMSAYSNVSPKLTFSHQALHLVGQNNDLVRTVRFLITTGKTIAKCRFINNKVNDVMLDDILVYRST